MLLKQDDLGTSGYGFLSLWYCLYTKMFSSQGINTYRKHPHLLKRNKFRIFYGIQSFLHVDNLVLLINSIPSIIFWFSVYFTEIV